MQKQSFKYQLLAVILRKLQAEKIQLGIGQYLQLQQLINAFPEHNNPEQLKLLLSPLIAKNEQQQEQFYTIFEESWKEVTALQATLKTQQELEADTLKVKQEERRDLSLIVLLLVVIIGGLLTLFFTQLSEDPILPPKPFRQMASILADSSFTFQIDTAQFDPRIQPVQDFHLTINDTATRGASSLGLYERVGDYGVRYTAYDTTGLDSILFVAIGGPDTLRQHIVLDVQINQPEVDVAETSIAEEVPDLLGKPLFVSRPENPVPNRDIFDLQKKQLSRSQQWLNQNLWWLRPLLTLLALSLFILVLRYRDRKRRKLVAEVEERDQPPYVWTLELEEVPEIKEPTHFNRLLRQLRQRTGGDFFLLDMPKTVKATIDKGGIVDFHYRQQTRPPEYLLLIDRNKANNHQARLFDWMYQEFKAQEVFMGRFFFDGDPRLCKNEQYPEGVRLNTLQYLYPNARLLIVTKANSFINRKSGKLARWTKDLTGWKQRAILSPKPLQEWGLQERQLINHFEVLPASIEGISFVIDQFDQLADRSRPREWINQVQDAYQESIEMDESQPIVPQLKQYFNGDLVRWIAACAVYPSLNWDLTLFLGDFIAKYQKTADEVEPLLTLPNLNALNQLPWFIQGKMSDQARGELVQWLQKEDPNFLRNVREALHALFQKQEIPVDSVAYQEFQLNVALNEYAFTRNTQKKRELEAKITENLEAGIEGDFTIIRELKGEPGPLDLVLPSNLRKYAYRAGYKGLGLKRSFRDLLIGGTVLLAIVFGIWWFLRAQMDPCLGEEVNYQDVTLCLETDADRLLYLEYKTKDALIAGEIDSAFIYLSLAKNYFPSNINLATEDVLEKASKFIMKDIDNNSKSDPISRDELLSVADKFLSETPGALDSSRYSYQSNIGRLFYNLAVPIANRAEDSIQNNLIRAYQAPKDSACVLFDAATSLGETGLYESFCTYERIYLQVDDQLRGNAIGPNIRGILRQAGFPAFGVDYVPVLDGNEVRIFDSTMFNLAGLIRDTLNLDLVLEQGPFKVVLVNNENADPRQIEVYYDQAAQPAIRSSLQIELQLASKVKVIPNLSVELYDLSGRRVGGKAKNSRRNTFDFFNLLAGIYVVNISSEYGLIKSVRVRVDANLKNKGRNSTRISLAIPSSQSVTGRVENRSNGQPLTRARIFLVDFPNIDTYTNNGDFSITLPGVLTLREEIPVYIQYESLATPGILKPKEKLDNYLFTLDIAPTQKQVTQEETTSQQRQQPTGEEILNYFVDPRDGQRYRTVTINNQTWMAQNLNYTTTDSWCYLELPELCAKAGRLYTWEAATKACPEGWHLPSNDEWETLTVYYGEQAYQQLVEGGESGFAALLGGRRSSGGSYDGLGTYGSYWTSTGSGSNFAWYYDFDGGKLWRGNYNRTFGRSVRCLQD